MSDILPAPYIATVLAEQDAFRTARPSIFPRAVRAVARPMGKLTNRLIPAEVIEAAIRGADWAARGSIRAAALTHEFASLEACDEAAGEVRRWALGYAVTGGGAAGAFGAVGLAIDVPATVALALRTVRLTGLCYGFGGDGEAEQAYILTVLQLAGANSSEERQVAIEALREMRSGFSREDWQKIAELTGQASGSAAAISRVAQILGVNLSTRKVAQVAPFVGAAVGAGVNAAFQNDVAGAARFAYRARWLEVNERLIEGSVS